MRILHVIGNVAPRYGGASKASVEMARAVARLGHSVSLYTTDQDGDEALDVPTDRPLVQNGLELRYYPVHAPRHWITSFPLARGLAEAIPTSDIVHVHSLYHFHGLVAGYLCRAHRVPYLITPHGSLDPFIVRRHRLRKSIVELLFERRNLRGAAAIHYTSEEERRLARPFVGPGPAAVVPLGIDGAEYADLPPPGTFRARHPETRDRRIVLFFGRVNFKKGLDILARAFGMCARERDDLCLVIAGPDDAGFGRRVRTWLEGEGVLSRTVFTGMLLGRDKLAALRDADVFVLPSYSENFGIAVIEAMACGTPVVVSDRVNIWRELAEARAARVAPCAAEAFARCMADVLDHPGSARAMTECGRRLVRERFDWASVGRQLERVYGSLRRDSERVHA